MILRLLAVGDNSKPETTPTRTRWQLVAIRWSVTTASSPTLHAHLSSFAGCNTFSGNYRRDGTNDRALAFHQVLRTVTRYELFAGPRSLLAKHGTIVLPF